ncbi:hypothetical protein NT239_05790 [Chitinibacter sp. SCUT-21]|uniref:hypothetical protein n=1 Tax=Chitinibacter sp. SCUT-21 TaxID=2970891 RepID=UPI0035A5EC44
MFAGPSYLQSCTRIFAPDAQYSVPVILNILKGISSAMMQLNSHGLIHVDVYAYNI